MFKTLCLALAMYVFPVALFVTTAERAETTGHTNLFYARGEDWDRSGDNYGVFRKGRYIYIRTALAPVEIIERNGKLVRVNTSMLKLLPVRIYSLTTPEEEALWRRYFSP